MAAVACLGDAPAGLPAGRQGRLYLGSHSEKQVMAILRRHLSGSALTTYIVAGKLQSRPAICARG